VEGAVVAETQDEAIDKINKMGLLPIDVDVEKETVKTKTSSPEIQAPRFHVHPHEVTIAYRQLARLVKSGVPILSALALTVEQAETRDFKTILETIQTGVREGYNFSVCLSAFKKIFSPFEIALIQTGETVGKLDEVLLRIANYRESQEELHSKLKSAMAYPVFVLVLGCATVFFMMTYVIPHFSSFFLDLGQELPFITKVLIAVSELCQAGGLWALLAVAVIFFLIRGSLKSKNGKLAWDRFFLKIPKIGKLIMMEETSRFCRTLELLIKSGVTIVSAVKISVPVMSNEAIRIALERCYQALQQGGYLSEALRNANLFPAFVIHLIHIGEESGRLDETLGEISDWYDKEISDGMRLMTQLLGPIMILIIGLFVGLIVVAVLLPIFNMNALVA